MKAPQTVILDLTDVPYIDSSGLGSLVSAYVSRQKAGQRVVLSGVNERILLLMEITRVEPLFLILPHPGQRNRLADGCGNGLNCNALKCRGRGGHLPLRAHLG